MYFNMKNVSSRNNLVITMDGNPLEQVKKYKYLGYTVDQQLNMKLQMTSTITKLNYILKIFKRIRPSLTIGSASMVFKAKVLSYINYILLISTLASKKDLKKIQTLQNVGIRYVFNLPKRCNVDEYHVKLNVLHVEQRRQLTVLLHMYKKSLDMPYPSPSDAGASTRSSGKILFYPPKPNSDKFLKSFVYNGAVGWNNLSPEEQLVQDIDLFKIQQKRKLLAIQKALFKSTS